MMMMMVMMVMKQVMSNVSQLVFILLMIVDSWFLRVCKTNGSIVHLVLN